jgi:hypothetical protein
MEEKLKKLKKFIKKTEEFYNALNDSLSNNKISFKEEEHSYLAKFHEKIYFIKEISSETEKSKIAEFNGILSSTSIEHRFQDLKVYCDSYPSSLDGTLTEPQIFKLASESLIRFIAILKVIKSSYSELVERNNTSLFDESNINKTDIIGYLNKSMEEFSKIQNIPPLEKEKLIFVYKEVIQEVEKPKTSWEKVLGYLNVLGLCVTLYTGTAQISEDIHSAYKAIAKNIKVEERKIELPPIFNGKSIYQLDNTETTILIEPTV